MKFVGRSRELGRLRQWWERGERPALVWGRRRVGKTALVQQLAGEHNTIFHTGAGRSALSELQELSRRAAGVLPSRFRNLQERPFSTWDEAFDTLAEASNETPIILVLDEFQEMLASTPELPGILRAFLDRSLGHTKLRILLCGSAVRTMQAIQEERAPLYGRFDLSMQLRPFRPHEVVEMLPSYPPEMRAKIYCLVGGMPLYLSWWNPDIAFEENLAELACQPDARMLTEGEFILATEAAKGPHLNTALDAIARGYTKHNEIGDAIGFDPTRTLNDLVKLQLVERVTPVTEQKESRKRIYTIADNFLNLYLKLLAPFRAEIDRGLGETILPAILGSIDELSGPAWEEAFRDHLRFRAAQIDPEIVAIGPWWDKSGQDELDAVALKGRSRKPMLVGEAKWGKTVNGARLAATVMRKAGALVKRPEECKLALCARNAVENAPPGTLVVTAEDIFGP